MKKHAQVSNDLHHVAAPSPLSPVAAIAAGVAVLLVGMPSWAASSSRKAASAASVQQRHEDRAGGDVLSRGQLVFTSVRMEIWSDDPSLASEDLGKLARHFGGSVRDSSSSEATVLVPLGSLTPFLKASHVHPGWSRYNRCSSAASHARASRAAGPQVTSRDLTDEIERKRSSLVALREQCARLGRLSDKASSDRGRLELERARGACEGRVVTQRIELSRALRRCRWAEVHVRLRRSCPRIKERIPRFRLPFPWLGQLGLSNLLRTGSTYKQRRYHRTMEGGWLGRFQQQVWRASDARLLGDRRTALAWGVSMRGLTDADPVGWAFAVDLGAGAGFSGGFLYDTRLMVGPGVMMGRAVSLSATTGIEGWKMSNAPVPASLGWPSQARIGLHFIPYVKLFGVYRIVFDTAQGRRDQLAAHGILGADEVSEEATAFVCVDDCSSHSAQTGVTFSWERREAMGTSLQRFNVGFSGYLPNMN